MEVALTLAVLAAAVVLFATEKLPVDVVAMIVLVSLLVLGLVTPAEALSGFASQATITVAAMFVLSAGLIRTGALNAITRLFSRIRVRWLFTLAVMITLAGMSAFVNNTAALAVFLPVVLGVAAANRFSPSKILIPMSYAAQMGGVCTLIGTSTNLLVHALMQDLGYRGFSLFEFAPLGLITMAAGMVYVLLFGPFVLPDRRAADLTARYELGKYITELTVQPDSALVGRSVGEAKLGEHGLYVLELLRGEEKVWSPRSEKLGVGDVLLVRGDWAKIAEFKDRAGLRIAPGFELRDEQLESPQQLLAEVMIAPSSRYVGYTLAQLEATWRHDAAVLAIHRRGEIIREQLRAVELNVGDVLLMLASREEMARLRTNTSLVVLTERADEFAGRGKAWTAIAVMVGVVLLAFLQVLPIVASALIGCIALVLTRCIEPEHVYEAIDWRVIVLLAGVLPMGIALQNSGAAEAIAGGALAVVGAYGPLAALATIYLLTAILTELMSNNASAVLMTPVAVATAVAVGADPVPFAVAVAFAASTSFATPVGYQTNTMVYNAGGYRFVDFVKLGVPLNLLFFVVAVIFIPRFWPL
jgi:di/tricarboxylate transporter